MGNIVMKEALRDTETISKTDDMIALEEITDAMTTAQIIAEMIIAQIDEMKAVEMTPTDEMKAVVTIHTDGTRADETIIAGTTDVMRVVDGMTIDQIIVAMKVSATSLDMVTMVDKEGLLNFIRDITHLMC